MKVGPVKITPREGLNLRLGIKSSMNNLAQLFGSLFTLYKFGNSTLEYSEEFVSDNNTQIRLKSELNDPLLDFYRVQLQNSGIADNDFIDLINDSPLFKKQLEPLQVTIELFWKLAKVYFTDDTLPESKERTGGDRFAKSLEFSSNLDIIDCMFLNNANQLTEEGKNLLFNLITNQNLPDGGLEDKLRRVLTVFSEETIYKIRLDEGEIIFQQEGIYSKLVNGDTVDDIDIEGAVGPFRVLKSAVSENFNYYLGKSPQDGFIIKEGLNDALTQYLKRVNTSLNLSPKSLKVEAQKEVAEGEYPASKDPINLILYGPPGTGKTYRLKNDYFPIYTTTEDRLSPEENFQSVVQELSWWQVIAIALLEEGKSKVSQLIDNRWIVEKQRTQKIKTLSNTIWGQLQTHTILESETVNVAKRFSPLIFNKMEDGEWKILENNVHDQCPEIIEIKTGVDNFEPEPGKPVKRYEFITFHQSYSYEDFIEGIKPIMLDDGEEVAGDLGYDVVPGIFKELCGRAEGDPNNRYAIFIDEINRGNVSQIFGELITSIEKDKRQGKSNELPIKLPYSKKTFTVPSNVDIYGTMNTADRSVEALDTALRRRFEFIEMPPDLSVIRQEIEGIKVSDILKGINNNIGLLLDKDHLIGHAYFINVKTKEDLANTFKNSIIPLLQEYFYGDYGKIGLVLGDGFIDKIINQNKKFAPFVYEGDEDRYKQKPSYLIKEVSAEEIMPAVEKLLNTPSEDMA
ncbi:McrB family protein [Lentiprolixibacter aurantiacus]|uniref:AAA family ATPase n=1 Tax=Lentiprolixibacter aurantiacus TaxID=2993939 RepID=A0AAE3SNR9_9FLAO|nr:AAA family ATPase [Lentiprolixibacter aurantiacus]MCX2718757.1 AAA family ATPase [Lentiprolixibacter aurantiacus]